MLEICPSMQWFFFFLTSQNITVSITCHISVFKRQRTFTSLRKMSFTFLSNVIEFSILFRGYCFTMLQWSLPYTIANQSSVQFSCVWLFATTWTATHQASLSITNSWNLLKLMSIESVMPSNHLILCRPLLLPSIFPSVRVFFSSSHQVARVLELQLQHQSFQWIFRSDLF